MTFLNRLEEFKELLPEEVQLLAVSKGHSASSIRHLANQGQLDFGESRFQEAKSKIRLLNDLSQIRWHFIGHIQANKVRGVVQVFDVIHSVDSLSLAQRISRISGEEGRIPQIMFQVKLRDDPSKGGFDSQDLLSNWTLLRNLPNILILGLMTIPPIHLNERQRKDLFEDCRNLANQLRLKDCSMGMSRDWEEAVEAGSTWIRIGSLLFGDRVGKDLIS